jgi:pentatricopeptide repeat protein
LEKCDSTKTLLNSIGYVEKDSDADLTRVKALSRHFNALFEGYRSLENPHKWTKETNSVLLPKEQCSILHDHMKSMNVAPDSYTITILMGLRRKPDEITEFWNNVMERTVIDIESPVYHSLLTAYGKAGDGASACYVFDKMIGSCNLHPNLKSWNILLSALNKASSQHPDIIFDCKTSSAAKMKFESEIINEKPFSGKDFIDIVNGLTAPQASKRILDLMNEARENSEISDLVLAPTSQAFCLVASALSHSRSIDPKGALDLYHNSVDNGLSIDGRFLNAIIRCYGDDISEALLSWKTVYRPAILASAPQKSNPSPGTMKKSRLEKNLIAGYHGLLYVAGKSYRPDIALRIAYAMSKEGVEPTEAALNTYNSGARLRDQGKERVRLHGQYENLLLVECAKYDSRDRRRLNEKRLRIII